MEVVEKISLTHFIWYLLPGLALLLLFLFPLSLINLDVAVKLYKLLGASGIIILAAVLGFVVEGLRLYRLRPKYHSTKQVFFAKLQTTLKSELDPYYLLSRVKHIATDKNIADFELRHSIWIMLGQLTALFFLESFFWFLAYIYVLYFAPKENMYNVFSSCLPWPLTIPVIYAAMVFFGIITLRLYYISMDEQRTTNNMILSFAEQNAPEIIRSL